MFNNTNDQKQGSELFGQQPPQQQSTGLFGQQQQPQQQQSIFGQNTSIPQQQQSTNLFGQPSSGLFGSTNTSQQQQQPPQQSTSLFGGFGASTSSQPQQQQQQQPQSSGFSFFGQNQSQQQQQAQQQAQAQQSSQSNAPVLFTRTTKFNDLPEDVRNKFEQIDAHIQGRVQISKELKQNKLGDEPQKGAEQIRAVHKDVVNAINKLRSDLASMRELKARMDQAVQDTIAATRIIDAFKASQNQVPAGPGAGGVGTGGTGGGQQSLMMTGTTPQSQTVWLKNYADFPLEFFKRVKEQLKERLQWFNTTLEQIERKLVSEANHVSVTPQSITSTLQAQHASFVALAAKTAALDGEMQKLKHTYRTLWRARTGSARDPFNELDRGSLAWTEFGIEGLSVA